MRIDARYHWLVGPGDIRLEQEEFDPDATGPDDLLCRTRLSAISPGTELAAFEGLEPLRPNTPAYPRWLGYMNIAEVIRAGANASSKFPEGTIVYSHTAHRSHFRIEQDKVLGVVPRRLSLAHASLAYLYRLAWAGLRRGRGDVSRDVAVVGLGAIGLCAIEIAARAGGRCLGVSDHGSARRAAEQISAAALERGEAERRFVKNQPPEDDRFAYVLVTTNGWRDWRIALSLARYGAIISAIGFPGRGQASPEFNPLDPAFFYDRQLTIMSAGLAAPGAGEGRENASVLKRDIEQLFDWMGAGRIDASRLYMGPHPAADLAGAYRRLKAPERGVGTLVLDWTGI